MIPVLIASGSISHYSTTSAKSGAFSRKNGTQDATLSSGFAVRFGIYGFQESLVSMTESVKSQG